MSCSHGLYFTAIFHVFIWKTGRRQHLKKGEANWRMYIRLVPLKSIQHGNCTVLHLVQEVAFFIVQWAQKHIFCQHASVLSFALLLRRVLFKLAEASCFLRIKSYRFHCLFFLWWHWLARSHYDQLETIRIQAFRDGSERFRAWNLSCLAVWIQIFKVFDALFSFIQI